MPVIRCPTVSEHPSIRIEVWRGDTIESVHSVAAVVVDRKGVVLERWGEEVVTFWRSSAKPFQAWAWVEDGTIDHFDWGLPEIAVMCASHVGTEEHAGLVRRMLDDIGLTEADLRCHPSLGARHECSGNHVGLLAAAAHNGWSVAGYLEPDHPAERASLRAVAEAARLPEDRVAVGVDGCGILTFATPISAAARALARLEELAPRVARAMRAFPVLVEGEGLLDTVLMQAFPGVTAKCGAEGLGCAALPDGRGVVVKALDGNDRATDPSLVALIARLLDTAEIPPDARHLWRPPVRNGLGDVVGELVAVLP
jgi:L-asparaginase II